MSQREDMIFDEFLSLLSPETLAEMFKEAALKSDETLTATEVTTRIMRYVNSEPYSRIDRTVFVKAVKG